MSRNLKKMQKKYIKKNQKKSTKKFKNPFFLNLKTLKIFFFARKNAILLVLPIEQISLRPEFSSPPRFRIQGE